jgi:hypothetical protein
MDIFTICIAYGHVERVSMKIITSLIAPFLNEYSGVESRNFLYGGVY